VTFDALRWLRDTGVAFFQLDWNGTVVIASGPRGPDQPDLRRAQAIVSSGVVQGAADAITCEILRVKLPGQTEVAGLLGFEESSATITHFAEGIAREIDGARALSLEAEAAWSYWNLWERMPIRFARRTPQRLGPNGQWRPGRTGSVAHTRRENVAIEHNALPGNDTRECPPQLPLRHSRIRDDDSAARPRPRSWHRYGYMPISMAEHRWLSTPSRRSAPTSNIG
jgi:hypothetical protein